MKLTIKELKIKSFLTSKSSEIKKAKKGTDGGYTWVG